MFKHEVHNYSDVIDDLWFSKEAVTITVMLGDHYVDRSDGNVL